MQLKSSSAAEKVAPATETVAPVTETAAQQQLKQPLPTQ
jgi:hypothetical protein